MSFGYAVGDVVAILSLFERVAIELRNYKNAPMHFQQLGVEIDLLRSTLQHVLDLNTNDPAERQTLERIRAIAMHCLQPLQALADKMQTKESSLGNFRSSKRLTSILTRINWSLMAPKDVDEIRKIILSELLAANILLSVQQLGCIKQLSYGIRDNNSQLSSQIDARARTITSQTSSILGLVQGVPGAIADLQSTAVIQAQQQAERIETLDQKLSSTMAQLVDLSVKTSRASTTFKNCARSMWSAVRRLSSNIIDIKQLIIFLSMCSKEMLEKIGRNTQILLGIGSHIERLNKAIEAIPSHIDHKIVHFDDALGVDWGLPFQFCETWQSFRMLLQCGVFHAGRPGAARVEADKFFMKIANTDRRIDRSNWERVIKAGLHIEQTMIVDSRDCDDIDECLSPQCYGTILETREEGDSKHCPDCGRSIVFRKATEPIAVFPQRNRIPWKEKADIESNWDLQAERNESLPIPLRQFGPIKPEELLATEDLDEIRHFKRIHLYEPAYKCNSLEEAMDACHNSQDYSTSHYIGFCYLQAAEAEAWDDETSPYVDEYLKIAINYLNEAISYDNTNAEAAYLLGRAYVQQGSFSKAHQALQNSLNWSKSLPSPAIWNTVGILYYKSNQFIDSRDAFTLALNINPYVWEVWHNVSKLYGVSKESPSYIAHFFECALELAPNMLDVVRRLERLKKHHGPPSDVSGTFDMREIRLQSAEMLFESHWVDSL